MIVETLAGPSRWLRDLPARTALKIANRPRVRERLGDRHEAALDRHRPALPSLSDGDQAIVDGLERDGIYVTSLDALGITGAEELLRTAGSLAEEFATDARALAKAGREFIIVDPALLVQNPAIFNWGLQDRILDIAEVYIGLPPAFDGVAINYTVADGREISTRSWHRDWEDRRILKVAVYLHDVDEYGGPFELISSDKARQCDRDGFAYGLAKDSELQRRFGDDYARHIVSCTGKTGTVIFADTARFFHRGRPATARDRKAIFYSYFARQPRHPFLCERSGMPRRDIYRLSDPLPQRQRDAAQWRRSLGMPIRLIPSATL